MKNPKILVISHNAFSSTNNMGKTLYNLFHGFNKDNLAQLYFHVLSPDVDICKTNFRITDGDVVRSIFHPSRCGRVTNIKESTKTSNIQIKSKVYQFGQKRTATKHLLRDLIWKLGHWKSKELFNWLDSYKPDVVFFAAGYSMFSTDIAMFITNKYQVPLITYFCDDYYDFAFSTHRFSVTSIVRMKLFRMKIRELVAISKDLVFISESMLHKYRSMFNKTGQVIMTPYNLLQSDRKKRNGPLIISYVGSVLSNRWKTLFRIGQALESINSNGLKVVLHIYSVALDHAIISKLSMGNSMIFKGAANFDLVKKIYHDSDILLHVESFAPEDIDRVRHSVSTKIADCLASNRAFLAVGPRGIASIDYLKENNAAYIIDDESMIYDKLNEFFIENDIDEQIMSNASELAQKNHDINKNSLRLKHIFEGVVKDADVR